MASRIPTRSRQSRNALFGLVGSLLFLTMSVALVVGGADGSVSGTIFFGLCAAVFAWQLWPGVLETERRSAELLLTLYPGPVVLRGSARKYLFLSAGSAAFGGAALQMLLFDLPPLALQILMWPGVVLFLGCAPLLLYVAARGTSLQLDDGGLVIRDAWRFKRLPWADANGFTTATLVGSSTPMVVFDDATLGNTRLASLNRTLTGRNTALPETFGLDPNDFAALLTAWRGRAVQAGAEPGPAPPELR